MYKREDGALLLIHDGRERVSCPTEQESNICTSEADRQTPHTHTLSVCLLYLGHVWL